MKAAIIMGQSEYQNVSSLTACKNDTIYIKTIITSSKAYERILLLDDNIKTASLAKDRIIEFVESLKNETVDELFLYFSGHGDFDDDEFFFIWSDFLQSKRRQTSLLNSEIDTLLRSLSPKLVVKIVDACSSGVQYIKDTDAIEKYLDKPDQKYKNCYFMFSSHNDQISYADKHLSHFTSSFIKSLNQDIGKKIRFKDIINFISDDFEQNGKQKPLFVTQADFTEIFFSMDKNTLSTIQQYISIKDSNTEGNELSDENPLLSLIKEDAKRYVELSIALNAVKELEQIVSNHLICKELSEIFDVTVNSSTDFNQIPKIDSIASWIHEHDRSIFVEITYKQRTYKERIPKNPLRVNFFTDRDDDEYFKTVIRTKNKPVSFQTKFELPINLISITYVSKFPNITNYQFVIVPLLSRTQLYLFFSKIDFLKDNWDDQKPDIENVNWSYTSCEFSTPSINDTIHSLLINSFETKIIEDISKRYKTSDIETPSS